MAPAVDQALRIAGKSVSNFSIMILGLVMLLGPPIALFAVSACVVIVISMIPAAIVGFLTGHAHGAFFTVLAGGLVIVAFIGSTIFVGRFAINYVWEPHLWPAISKACDALTHHV